MAAKVKPEEVIRHEAVYSVGLDVSQRSTSVCVLDPGGRTVLEGQAKTNPFEIGRYLKRMEEPLKLGMETGSLASWLYHGLRRMGFDITVMDAVHAHQHCPSSGIRLIATMRMAWQRWSGSALTG